MYSRFHKTLSKSSLQNALDFGKVLWNGGYLKQKGSHYGSRKKKKSSTSGRATKALPPPLELSGHRNFFFEFFFSLKIAKNGFWQFFFHPTIFGLK